MYCTWCIGWSGRQLTRCSRLSTACSHPRALYRQLIAGEGRKSLLFSLQGSVTGYEGFVRIGTRRGFHLLLVHETETGFQPVLPTAP